MKKTHKGKVFKDGDTVLMNGEIGKLIYEDFKWYFYNGHENIRLMAYSFKMINHIGAKKRRPCTKAKKIRVFNEISGVENKFRSMEKAAEFIGVIPSTIAYALKKGSKIKRIYSVEELPFNAKI